MLATAVVAAVTTPVLLLSVTPALADTAPSGASRTQGQGDRGKPSVEELEKAAEKAQKVYDDAVAADRAARDIVDAALSDEAPRRAAPPARPDAA
ncbi:peptidase, partial [Streptomyces sp. NPDC059096]